MNRRRVLASAGVALFGLLGGCTGSDDSGAEGTGTSGSSGTDASTGTSGAAETTQVGSTSGTGTTATGSTATPTPASMPTEVTTGPSATNTAAGTTATSMPVPDPRSTQSGEGATVTFENGGSRVVVTGTIVAQDGCRRAVLDSVRPNGGTLVVSVGTERDAGTDVMCTQALTPVEYRFAVTPDDPPDSVRVVHGGVGDRRTVATADRTD